MSLFWGEGRQKQNFWHIHGVHWGEIFHISKKIQRDWVPLSATIIHNPYYTSLDVHPHRIANLVQDTRPRRETRAPPPAILPVLEANAAASLSVLAVITSASLSVLDDSTDSNLLVSIVATPAEVVTSSICLGPSFCSGRKLSTKTMNSNENQNPSQ